MPSKRRVVPASSDGGEAKRSKVVILKTASAAIDLTAHNALHSPLLRLPAELRNAIWEFAFGNRMIGVSFVRTHDDPDCELIEFVSYEAVSNGPISSLSSIKGPYTPNLVCRQFWAETSQVFLSSCVFRVDHPDAFRALALSGQSVVPRITRLMVRLSGTRSHNFPMYSHDAFTSSLVGRFVSLEGLVLTGMVYWAPRDAATAADVMGSACWKSKKLPVVIRAFQQHKLQANLTSVTFEPESYFVEPVWDATPYNEAIRIQLLDHHPRRLSKRGL